MPCGQKNKTSEIIHSQTVTTAVCGDGRNDVQIKYRDDEEQYEVAASQNTA